MAETPLVSKLVKHLRTQLPGSVIFKHHERITAGVPDVSITWNGMTTFLEIKHLNPRLISRGIQELTMKRLAVAGSCFYVIYDERVGRMTAIVRPGELWKTGYNALVQVPGFDNELVVNFIRGKHRRDH